MSDLYEDDILASAAFTARNNLVHIKKAATNDRIRTIDFAAAPAGDGPGALSGLRVVGHAREQPAQLDRGCD